MKPSVRPPPMDFGAAAAQSLTLTPDTATDAVDTPPTEAVQVDPPGATTVLSAGPQAEAATPAKRDPATVAAVRTETRKAPRGEGMPAGAPVWITASAVAGLWTLAPIAFAFGYRNQIEPLRYEPFALVVFALLAIGPAALILVGALVVRQAQRLAFEARRSARMTEDMVSPALLASQRTTDVVQSVRDEIARAGEAADQARQTLVALNEALALETERLAAATAQSLRTAQELASNLGRERGEMAALSQTLDAQAMRVSDTIDRQARMVADAAGVAESQLREAETVLSGRAADLVAAAGELNGVARTAGDDLVRHTLRLEQVGVGVGEQIQSVETGLNAQRQALVALSEHLRADHGDIAARMEADAQRLGAYIAESRRLAAEVGEAAAAGGEAVERVLGDTLEQFRRLAAQAQQERDVAGESASLSVQAVVEAAHRQRADLEAQTRAAMAALSDAAEQSRAAAARHAAAAREQLDHLSETAFAAGQKANQVFEARLEEARGLVEESTRMIEQAGAATAARLAKGAEAARAALNELTSLVEDLDRRAAELPNTARAQTAQVEAAVEEGVDALMAQARRTAEEAHAIDAAFQDRVRRNYEVLAEAVRFMGVATGGVPMGASAGPALETRAPPARRPDAPVKSALATPEPMSAPPVAEPAPPEPVAAHSLAAAEDESETLERLDQEAAAGPTGAEIADRLGLRSRIKLTPTALDREFTAVFKSASGLAPPAAASAPQLQTSAPASAETVSREDEPADEPDDDANDDAGAAWTWKDLLSSLEEADGGGRLEDDLAVRLSDMGLDVDDLLPERRIPDVIRAYAAGDVEGALDLVRSAASAATRRIARRLFTDEDLRRKAATHVRRYKTLTREAATAEPELDELLRPRAGRLFLLLEASGGDLL